MNSSTLPYFDHRYCGHGQLCQDKISDVIVAYSKDANSIFKFGSEGDFDMANPLRAFYSPDFIQQFGRRDHYRWTVNGKMVNRCQKPVPMMRWVQSSALGSGAVIAPIAGASPACRKPLHPKCSRTAVSIGTIAL
jgi:hypothetical protein